MIQNASILLLDEATSALDAESESLIKDAISKLMTGRTSIVVAHRLSTIQDADAIIVMQNGKIVEQGTHEELLDINGTYFDLVQKQM
jgi:subfamily B ATP-binding cassette protein MsbA